MKHTILLILIFSATLAHALPSNALPLSTSRARITGSQFENLIAQVQKTCPSVRCLHQPLILKNLSASHVTQLEAATRAGIRRAMVLIADIWPDTIMEGGFDTNFRLRLDRVEAVMLGAQLAGYRLTFSAEAWDENENRLPGRIIEHGFVSQDFSVSFRDEAGLARFQPGAR